MFREGEGAVPGAKPGAGCPWGGTAVLKMQFECKWQWERDGRRSEVSRAIQEFGNTIKMMSSGTVGQLLL